MDVISLARAAKKYNVSKQGLYYAIRHGLLPAMVVQVDELRVKPKDVEAWVAKIPPNKRRAGRMGGLRKAANIRARTRKPSGGRSDPVALQA